MKPFEPDEREQRLIEEAVALAKKAVVEGHYAPDELVNRMTEEVQFVAVPDASPIRMTLVATVDERTSREALGQWIGSDGCISAALYEFPRAVLVVEFVRAAASGGEAISSAVGDVRRRFPSAVFVDVNDQNTLLDSLVEASTRRPLTDIEMVRMMGTVVPNRELAYGPLARAALDDLADGVEGGPSHAEHRGAWTEATVFDVLPELDLVHLTTAGGTMLNFSSKTPVARGLAAFEEGQVYRCLVMSRFSIVLRAELIERL